MSFSHSLIVVTLKAITGLICRIDDQQLKGVPPQGPLIIYTNHVNILEIPIIYTHLQPRKVHGMVLAERWNNPILNWMLTVTETIPLHRAQADLDAIRQGLAALGKGRTLIISPEGTRSHNGKLQPAHPGAVLLALHSHAPLLPVAYFGAEAWRENLTHLKRTDFHMRVGQPFHLDGHGERVTHTVRQQMIDEMMVQLASLLPAENRGYYSDLSKTNIKYIDFG